MKSFLLTCAAFAVYACAGWQLFARTAINATATVQYANGDTITVSDFSNQFGIQPREFVNITVQFSPAPAGQPVIIEAPDGGTTSFGSSIPVIDSSGSISFGFLAPAQTGFKSIGIRIGSTRFVLQFSVVKAN
jgi:hypothetical protein